MLTYEQKKMGFAMTDTGFIFLNANKFALYFYRKYKILYNNGQFYFYSKKGVYKMLPSEGLAAKVAQLILDEYLNIYEIDVHKEIINTLKMIAYCDCTLNKYKYLINMKNGMFDTQTDKLLPHDMNYYSTIQIPIEFDKNAKCPNFDKFLDTTFCGNKILIRLVQEMMGYCLVPDTSAQCFFILYGTGANGKSVLCEIIEMIVGKGNYTTIPIRELSKSFSRANLKDKALNISTENESLNGRGFDTQYLKAISGGDIIPGEFKGKNAFSFRPFCKLIFSVNSFPNFNDKTQGFFRRIKIIPFEASFSIKDGTADIHILDKLKNELPGIFNFALKGLNRLKKNDYKFTECKKINKYFSEYEKMVDPYVMFIDECIYFGETYENLREPKTSIYEAFILWANKNNHLGLAKVTSRKFWMDFEAAIYRNKKIKLVTKKSYIRYIIGVSLKKYRPKEMCASTPRNNLIKTTFFDDSYENNVPLTSEEMKKIISEDDDE